MSNQAKVSLNSILGPPFGNLELYTAGFEITSEGIAGICDILVIPIEMREYHHQSRSGRIAFEKKVLFAIKSRGEVLKHEIPMANLSSVGCVDAFSNFDVIFEENEDKFKFLAYLRKIVKKNIRELPRKLVSSNVGWQRDGTFFLGGSDGNYVLDSSFPALSPCGDVSMWVQSIEPLLGNVAFRITLALSFASVCVKRLNIQTSMLLLFGATGAGKTTLQKIAASVWADPRGGAFIQTASSTDVNLASMAIFLSGLPLCIDELETRSRTARTSQFLMQLSEGYERGTYKVKHKESSTSCLIMTGESPLISNSSNPGLANRLLELEVADDTLANVNVSDIINSCAQNSGTAGRVFIAYMLATTDADLSSQYWRIKQTLYDLCREKGITISDKKVTMLSLVLMGDKLAFESVYSRNVSSEIELLKADDLVSAFCGDETDPAIMAFENFRDYVLVKDVKQSGNFVITDKVMVCSSERDYLYVVRNFAEEFSNFKAFRSVWAQKGLIVKNPANNGYCFDKMIGGERLRFYKVKIRTKAPEVDIQ